MAAVELDEASQQRTGGCQCGAIRYTVTGPINALYVCHCRECQKQSASAFGVSAVVDGKHFQLAGDAPLKWSRLADSGSTIDCYFCRSCGSRLWHQSPNSDAIRIKAGSLDEPVDLRQAIHIWTSRKVAGVIIPGTAQQFATSDI